MNEEVLVLYRATSDGYEQVKSYENQSNQLPNFSDDLLSQDSYILIKGSKKRFDDLLLSKTKNNVIDYAILEEYAIKNSFGFSIESTNDERVLSSFKSSINFADREVKASVLEKDVISEKVEPIVTLNENLSLGDESSLAIENELKALNKVLAVLDEAQQGFSIVKDRLQDEIERLKNNELPVDHQKEEEKLVKDKVVPEQSEETDKKKEEEKVVSLDPDSNSLNIDAILIKAENIRNDIIQIGSDLDALDVNDVQRESKLSILSDRADGVGADMEELRGAVTKRIDELKVLHEEKTEKVQVFLLKTGNHYSELFSRNKKEGFFSEHEFNEYLKQVEKKFPGCEISTALVNRKLYESIDKLQDTNHQQLNALLKEDCIQFTGKVPENTKQVKQIKEIKVEKENKKLENVLKEKNRNVIDAMANYTKITYYSIKKAIKNLINGFIHGANKSREKKVINRAAKNDTIQIVAIQQADGSFHELKTERNKDLFLHESELKSYAEHVSNNVQKARFYLLEVPKSEYPQIGKYLEKGIMTDDNKQKYNEAKREFLKRIAPKASASCETNATVTVVPESSSKERKNKKKETFKQPVIHVEKKQRKNKNKRTK